MSDPLHIVHSAEQPSYEELREQYREENRKRVHAMLREDTITFRDKDGNYLRDSKGEIVRRKTGYLTDAPAGHEHQRLDDFCKQGGRVPDEDWGDCAEFAVVEGAGLDRELRDLTRDAHAMAEAERVAHPEVESLEGPPLASLEDGTIFDYLDKQLKETNGQEAKCSDTYAGIDRSTPAFPATADGPSGTLTPEVLKAFFERTKGS